jgi:hypothetical protein
MIVKNTFIRIQCPHAPTAAPPPNKRAGSVWIATTRRRRRAVEREIDQVVYGLYGLKAEEIKIVEGSMHKHKKAKVEGDNTD